MELNGLARDYEDVSKKVAERNVHNIIHIQASDYHELPWVKEVYDNRAFGFTGLVIEANNNLYIVTRRKTIVYCRRIIGTIHYHLPNIDVSTINYELEVYANSIEWDLCVLVTKGKDYFDPNIQHEIKFFNIDQIKLTDSQENSLLYTAVSEKRNGILPEESSHNEVVVHRGHFDQYVNNTQRKYLPGIVEFLGTFNSIPPETCLGIPVFNNQCQLIGIINHWNNIMKKQYCIIPGFVIYSFLEEVSGMIGYFPGIYQFPIKWNVIKDEELSLSIKNKDKFFMKVKDNIKFESKNPDGTKVDRMLKKDDVIISINGYPIEFFRDKDIREPHIYDLKFDIYLPFDVFCQIHCLGGKPVTLVLERKGKIIEKLYYPEIVNTKNDIPYTHLPPTRPHLYDFRSYIKYRSWIFMVISHELKEIFTDRNIILTTNFSTQYTLISDAPDNIILQSDLVKIIQGSNVSRIMHVFTLQTVDEKDINCSDDLIKISTGEQHNFSLSGFFGDRERISEVYY